MKENTVVAFQNPSDFQKDPLTEVLQAGARELLAQAVEAEVSVFLGSHAALVDAAVPPPGCPQWISAGTLHPDRDRPGERAPTPCAGPGGRRHPLHVGDPAALSAPRQEPGRPFAMAVSEGHFHRRLRDEALAALLGSSAPGLSASTITRLKEVWGVDPERWQRRDLTAKRYVYFWRTFGRRHPHSALPDPQGSQHYRQARPEAVTQLCDRALKQATDNWMTPTRLSA